MSSHFKEIQDKYFEGEKNLNMNLCRRNESNTIIRRFEEIMFEVENTRYGKFSESLSDKFWELVGLLPHIEN
jgi:hypothetical protein